MPTCSLSGRSHFYVCALALHDRLACEPKAGLNRSTSALIGRLQSLLESCPVVIRRLELHAQVVIGGFSSLMALTIAAISGRSDRHSASSKSGSGPLQRDAHVLSNGAGCFEFPASRWVGESGALRFGRDFP